MEFLKKFSNKPTPKDVAKDRLRLILIHDRGDLPQEILEKIRMEMSSRTKDSSSQISNARDG